MAAAASMRPGDFSPGNTLTFSPSFESIGFNEAGGFLPRKRERHAARCTRPQAVTGFNEAGGFLPRKRQRLPARIPIRARCFNEAGGFLPRKLDQASRAAPAERHASMRPGDFSPGNYGGEYEDWMTTVKTLQ